MRVVLNGTDEERLDMVQKRQHLDAIHETVIHQQDMQGMERSRHTGLMGRAESAPSHKHVHPCRCST